MGAHSVIDPPLQQLDEISTFLPGICPEEHALRSKLRVARALATSRIAEVEPGHTTQLLWMVVDISTQWMFASASIDELDEITTHVRRLLVVADAAEKLEAMR